tara:strand:+ start:115 stop:594 length:480 start_codon:yes stop_codon:yes gene_type:complete
MKLAKTIRFDKSDLNVFEIVSDEGEWAVSGAFEYSKDTISSLSGKRKQSFANGFLGLNSFGRSTLVTVTSINKDEKILLINNLANYFVKSYGAPSFNLAYPVAEDEIKFMMDLCQNQKLGTLLAVNRKFETDGIHESFSNLPKPDACSNQKIWTTVENE